MNDELKELTDNVRQIRRELDRLQIECDFLKEGHSNTNDTIKDMDNTLMRLAKDLRDYMYGEEKGRNKLYITLLLLSITIIGTFAWDKVNPPEVVIHDPHHTERNH